MKDLAYRYYFDGWGCGLNFLQLPRDVLFGESGLVPFMGLFLLTESRIQKGTAPNSGAMPLKSQFKFRLMDNALFGVFVKQVNLVRIHSNLYCLSDSGRCSRINSCRKVYILNLKVQICFCAHHFGEVNINRCHAIGCG